MNTTTGTSTCLKIWFVLLCSFIQKTDHRVEVSRFQPWLYDLMSLYSWWYIMAKVIADGKGKMGVLHLGLSYKWEGIIFVLNIFWATYNKFIISEERKRKCWLGQTTCEVH